MRPAAPRPDPPGTVSDRRAEGSAEPPLGTNAWARRTITTRAEMIGLAPDAARQVGNVAVWYYNRVLLELNKKGAVDQELSPGTNRYLVPITLALASEYIHHPVALERLLRLSGTPTPKTVENARRFYSRCARMLTVGSPAAPVPRRGRPATARPSRPGGFPSAPVARPAPVAGTAKGPVPKPAPRPVPTTVTTALAQPPPEEIVRLRRLAAAAGSPPGPARPSAKPREHTTNNWARKRIAEVCRSQGIPDAVRVRALQTYERIVDLHSVMGHAPAGKRLQLSPRLNSSLVYTTVYLACRMEQYPRDLPEILGHTPAPGTLREMYRLYRFYKRELHLPAGQVDVRTFIASWLDGFDLVELMKERSVSEDSAWLKARATTIAHQVQGAASLRNTSTKVIAAGALTTALAERSPPSNLGQFYRAVANFLHLSEESLRFVVTRIAGIL